MEKRYYITSNNENLGPFSLLELKDKGLNPHSLIWYEGLTEWIKAEELEELEPYIAKQIVIPLTPKQIKGKGIKIKQAINSKLFIKAIKKAGISLVLVFVAHFLLQYVILTLFDNGLEKFASDYIYVNSSSELIIILLISSLLYSLLISIVLFIVYYIIERQKTYKGLLTLDEENDRNIYERLVCEHDAKYIYDKPRDSIAILFGYFILTYNLAVGFFPEIVYFQLSELNLYVILVVIITRVIPLIFTELVNEKDRTHHLKWIVSLALFPAISLILLGSLPKINRDKKN